MDAVILDLDGTLYSYPPCHDAGLERFGEAWSQLGLGTPEDGCAAYLRGQKVIHRRLRGTAAMHHRLLYAREAVDQRLGRSDVKLTLALEHAYWSAYFETMTLRPGARSFLEALKERSVPTVLLTDLVTFVQMHKLQALKLEGLFDFLVTSEDVGEEKPSPLMLQAALEKLGKAAGPELWMVGDSWEKDMVPAQEMGLSTVWIRGNESRTPPPTLILPDFSTALAEMTSRERS